MLAMGSIDVVILVVTHLVVVVTMVVVLAVFVCSRSCSHDCNVLPLLGSRHVCRCNGPCGGSMLRSSIHEPQRALDIYP